MFVAILVCLSSFAVKAQSGYYAELENNYVVTSNISELNNSTELTMEMDVYIDSLTTWTNLLGQQDSSTNRVKLLMHNGEVYAVVANGANTLVNTTAIKGQSTLTAGKWHHIAMTYNGTSANTINIYIDGVKQNVKRCGACIYPSKTAITSRSFQLVAAKFKGKVDNTRVWSKALSPTTILNWHHQAVTLEHPNYQSLVLNWEFQDSNSLNKVLASHNTSYLGDVYTKGKVIANLTYERQYLTNYVPFNSVNSIHGKTNPAPFSTHFIYTHISANPTGQIGRYFSATEFVAMTPGSSLEASVGEDIAKIKSWTQGQDVELFQTFGGNKASPALNEYSQNPIILSQVVKDIEVHLDKYDLAGVDINWEQHPLADSYNKFFTALRNELDPKYKINITVNGNHYGHKHLKQTIKAFADTVQLMFYDSLADTTHYSLANIKQQVALWTSGNDALDKQKIIIGMPGYAIPNLPFAQRPKPIAIRYSKIVAAEPNIPSSRDHYDYTNGHRYYFNGVDTIKEKTQWAKENGYKGVMFWQLDHDVDVSSDQSLIKAASETMGVQP